MFSWLLGEIHYCQEELSGTVQGDLVNIPMIYACGRNHTNIYTNGMVLGRWQGLIEVGIHTVNDY